MQTVMNRKVLKKAAIHSSAGTRVAIPCMMAITAALFTLTAQAELTWLNQRSPLTKAKEHVDNLLTPSATAADCPHDAAVLDL